MLYPPLSLGVPFGPDFGFCGTNDVFTAFNAASSAWRSTRPRTSRRSCAPACQAVDAGQAEAANALGMKEANDPARIVLPQAMRVIVPPTGNETISMLKTTSLVLAVPFTLDLTFVTNAIGNRLFLPIPLLMVAAIWYLLITSVLMVGQHYLERYYGRGFAGAGSAPRGGKGRAASSRPSSARRHHEGRPVPGVHPP